METPNYKRVFLPLPTVSVPRIIIPLRLPRHTTTVLSNVDVDDLPFCVAKHYLHDANRKIAYVHRLHNGGIIVAKPQPPNWLNE